MLEIDGSSIIRRILRLVIHASSSGSQLTLGKVQYIFLEPKPLSIIFNCIQLLQSRKIACSRRSELAQHASYLEIMEPVHISKDSSGGKEAGHPPVYCYIPPAW
jgi:hypothetical protein